MILGMFDREDAPCSRASLFEGGTAPVPHVPHRHFIEANQRVSGEERPPKASNITGLVVSQKVRMLSTSIEKLQVCGHKVEKGKKPQRSRWRAPGDVRRKADDLFFPRNPKSLTGAATSDRDIATSNRDPEG